MKKSNLFFGFAFAAIGLMALGFINWNPSDHNHRITPKHDAPLCGSIAEVDLNYGFSSHFMNTISKKRLHEAIRFSQIVPNRGCGPATKKTYRNVEISILKNDEEISEIASTSIFNEDQIKLLRTTDYATNFYARAEYITEYAGSDYVMYYMTVVPEIEATYEGGSLGVLEYLKENSKGKTSMVKEDQLEQGKVNFTVKADGSIANVDLSSTCGYDVVDNILVGLISNMPDKWTPAKNADGECIDQQFVISFGRGGC